MATNEQILQYLLSGGTHKGLKKNAGLTQKQILAALFSSPQNVTALQDYVSKSVAPYATYDTSQTYDTTTPNAVRTKYEMYGPTYKTLVDDYFNTVDNAGGNPAKIDAFVNDLNSKMDEASSHYGIPKDELSTMLTSLQKDSKKYITQHQKNQFAAFQKLRKAKGITGDTDPKQGFVTKLLGAGTAGLADMPTTLEGVAKKKAAAWAAEKYKDLNAEDAKAQIANYEKSFVEAAKKKKRSALHYGAMDILKTLGQE
jgi:hypothetical protein